MDRSYNLAGEKFVILFDGEAVDIEGSTPEDLGLEDDDLLDIKVSNWIIPF